MKCKKCGHQNPHSARYCGNCRHELVQEQERTLFRKYGVLIVSCVAVLCVMIGLLIQKDESPEKDESPTQVIELEQVTEPEGNAHIHTWTDATCTSYTICTGCGITNGFKLSHKWTEGTCLEPGVCEVCGTVSTLPSHQWGEDMPKACILCGKTWAAVTNADQRTKNEEKIFWAEAYLKKAETAMKEDKNAKAILHDLNEDGIPEMIIAQEAELPEKESDFGWDIYSVYSFQNGKIKTVEEHKSICPVGMCNDSKVDIIYHNGKAQLLVQSMDVYYNVEHEDGVFNEFKNTRKIYSFDGSSLVEKYEILIDAHEKYDSDDRENEEERLYSYINGNSVQYEDVQAVLNNYTGIYRDTMFFFDYLDYESEEAAEISYIYNYLLKEIYPEKDTISIAYAIQDWLPFATYAMTDAEKVYSYSDATLTERTKQYYFNSRTDEIVILDISKDGSAMYVRYPSTISGTGYRDCWFAAEDILGPLEPTISTYTADAKIKIYRRNDNDSALIYYDMISQGTEIWSLGEHIWGQLIIYPLTDSENILDITVTNRMALTSPYDKPNELEADGYKTFLDYLDYGYVRPDRVLTKNWAEGGIKIGFLSRRELYFELTDSYMSGHSSTSEPVPLTSVFFSADQNDRTGFAFTFSMQDQLQFEIYFTDAEGEREWWSSYSDVQGYYSNGCVTMYLALEENIPWDVYDLTSISVGTHQNEAVREEYIVTQGNKTVEIHCDSISKIQSVQNYFSALDAQGNVLWTHVTQERQDRGQMSGIKYIGYINDIFLFDDNDTIVALDAETGKELWKRQDFDGVINAWDVSVDGTLFFAGSYAPDLFVVSENGKLLKEVEELAGIDEKRPYVNKIWVYDDYLIVGVAQYWDGWEQKYRVDLDDYTCTIISEPQT